MAEKSGPEEYAPLNRRSPEKLNDIDRTAAGTFEGEIREFIQRDASLTQRRIRKVDSSNNPAAENLSAQVQHIAGVSMDEVDRVVRELESVRDMLSDEGERVSREIAGYASLSHAATMAMKVIGDSIKQWKGAQDTSEK